MTRKRRLLIHGDSVCKPSGFGHVIRTLIGALDDWEVVQVALNHPGALAKPPPGFEHVRVIDARASGKGDLGFSLAKQLYLEENFDLFFVMQDLHIAQAWTDQVAATRDMRRFRNLPKTPVLYHFPVDGMMLADHEFIGVADASVVPTAHANGILKDRGLIDEDLPVIPHAVNPAFTKLPLDERRDLKKRIFGIADPDVMAILWLAVNAPRKDPFTAMQAVQALHRRYGVSAKIHFHTPGRFQGMDIFCMARAIRMDGLSFQVSDTTLLGVPPEELNSVYNAADCLLFTSRREGVGIPMMEAMATGTPVVAPDYGPFAEVLDHGELGYLHKPAMLQWAQGDNRGPHHQSCPKAVADALAAFWQIRDTHKHTNRMDLALGMAQTKYEMKRVQKEWRDFVYDLLSKEVA